MTRLEWKIAARYLRSRRSSRSVSLITLIATGGVTVGVMALIVVLGVMNGLQNELRDRILVGSAHVQILTYGTGLRIDSWQTALDSIREHPEVIAASPFVWTQSLITSGADWVEGIQVKGIDPDTGQASVTSLASHFTQGDLRFVTEDPETSSGIVLGYRLAERLQVHQGWPITLVSAAGTKFNSALGAYIPSYERFEVSGEMETGMYEYDNAYVVMPLAAAQRFAGLDSAVSGIEVRIRNPWNAKAVGESIAAMLDYPFRSYDWQTQNASLFAALRLEKLGMALVLLLIVIVAAFNIVSTLTMVVTDKTKEIGILRAMGLPAKSIRNAFVLQGSIIGLVGTSLGGLLGLIVARVVDSHQLITIPAEVYFIDHLPVQVTLVDTMAVVLASLLVATIATIHPARHAAGFIPVQAIRDQ